MKSIFVSRRSLEKQPLEQQARKLASEAIKASMRRQSEALEALLTQRGAIELPPPKK